MYLVGGVTTNRRQFLACTDCCNLSTGEWSTLPTELSVARSHHAAAVHNGKLYVCGGKSSAHNSESMAETSVEVCDLTTGQWHTLSTPMLTGRRSHAMALHGDKLYVVGGLNAQSVKLKSVEVCDLTTNQWTTLPAPMTGAGRFGHTAVVDGGKMYIF
jgi:N-acetylneuraminic acid mutarotase